MTKPQHTGFDAPYLDSEEREIMESLERGPIIEDKTQSGAQAEWRAVLEQGKRVEPVTLRMQSSDIERLKARALEKGLSHQDLMSSILHEYAEGNLKENA